MHTRKVVKRKQPRAPTLTLEKKPEQFDCRSSLGTLGLGALNWYIKGCHSRSDRACGNPSEEKSGLHAHEKLYNYKIMVEHSKHRHC